jgi:hypothetical protein
MYIIDGEDVERLATAGGKEGGVPMDQRERRHPRDISPK